MAWSPRSRSLRLLAAMLSLLTGLALAATARADEPAGRQKRIALVIGNAAYEAGALATPANDAGLVAQTLQAAGFDVVGARDLDDESLRKALRDFADKAAASGPDTVAFLYLSGYGLQLSGENYFVPVDARIPNAADVPVRALRLSDYIHQLAAIPLRARFVVLDAARPAPFAKSGDPLAGGLALTEADPGTLVAFNAAPGTVGPVEKGPYGAYAQALVEMIREGGLPPAQLFDRVRMRVDAATKGAEVPWDSSRIEGDVVFFQRAADAPPVSRPEAIAALGDRPLKAIGAHDAYAVCLERDTLEGYHDFVAAYPDDAMARRVRALIAARREAVTWRRTWIADSRDAYWSYLERYPRGPHAWDARRRLRQLAAALEPPPHFTAFVYDVPPPPPDEIVYVDRPALDLDDPVYALAPPPPPPVIFLPPQPAYLVDLAPPPPPVAVYALPTPAFVPIPVYVSAPAYVAPPPNNVIYQNIHNVTVINAINEHNAGRALAAGAVSPGAGGLAGGLAGATLGAAAAAHVPLPPALAQRAALHGPPAGQPPGQVSGAPAPLPGAPQVGHPLAGHALPGQPGALAGPNAPAIAAHPQSGQPLPGTGGQPLPPQALRPGQLMPGSTAPGRPAPVTPPVAARPPAQPPSRPAGPGPTAQPRQDPRQDMRQQQRQAQQQQRQMAQQAAAQRQQMQALQAAQRQQAMQARQAEQRQQQMLIQQQRAAQRQQQAQARQAARVQRPPQAPHPPGHPAGPPHPPGGCHPGHPCH